LLLRRTSLSEFEMLCLCVLLAGFAAFLLFNGPYAAEEYFRDLGYLAIVPVAAAGLADFWSHTPATARRNIAIGSASVLVLGLIIAGGSWLLALSGHAAHVWFFAMYTLVVTLVGLVAFRLSSNYDRLLPSRPRRVIACCIPLVSVLGLVKPMAFAAVGARATVLRQRIAAVDSSHAYGMTAALYRGLIWVRMHTLPCDVLAVNNHGGFPHTDGRPSVYLYYSAFTERRIFLESWLYTPGGIAGRRPYPRRLALNDDAILRGSSFALTGLASEGVSYVLVDKTHGPGVREPSDVSRLVFSNSALAVYRLAARPRDRSTRLGCSGQNQMPN
jgi:hypothetical protein